MSNIIGVCGFKNSGKTTLIEGLIKWFSDKNITTAVIKHDGHCFAVDRENTDTRRFFDAGAACTAIFDGEKYQIVKKMNIELDELIHFFSDADVIFIEGCKLSEYPKIWIGRDIPKDIKNIFLTVEDGFDIDYIGEIIFEFIKRK